MFGAGHPAGRRTHRGPRQPGSPRAHGRASMPGARAGLRGRAVRGGAVAVAQATLGAPSESPAGASVGRWRCGGPVSAEVHGISRLVGVRQVSPTPTVPAGSTAPAAVRTSYLRTPSVPTDTPAARRRGRAYRGRSRERLPVAHDGAHAALVVGEHHLLVGRVRLVIGVGEAEQHHRQPEHRPRTRPRPGWSHPRTGSTGPPRTPPRRHARRRHASPDGRWASGSPCRG